MSKDTCANIPLGSFLLREFQQDGIGLEAMTSVTYHTVYINI